MFYDQLQTGDRVLLFGAIHTEGKDPSAAPEVMDPGKATNYRRWWNNPWKVVEAGGQPNAGEWTAAKMNRLRALVERAHANGLWIRFYTLDGATKAQLSCNGWFHDYNFGSLDKARVRWRAAIAAHVDYLASDQYEEVAQEIHRMRRARQMTVRCSARRRSGSRYPSAAIALWGELFPLLPKILVRERLDENAAHHRPSLEMEHRSCLGVIPVGQWHTRRRLV